CVVVFDGQKGVEAQSETVWRQADKYRVPRLIFINKMDIVGADFDKAVEEVRERLQGRPVPVTIGIGSGSPKDSPTPFQGVVDLITMEACFFEHQNPGRPDGKIVQRYDLHGDAFSRLQRDYPIPERLLQEAERWRENLFNVITESDDKDLVTSA